MSKSIPKHNKKAYKFLISIIVIIAALCIAGAVFHNYSFIDGRLHFNTYDYAYIMDGESKKISKAKINGYDYVGAQYFDGERTVSYVYNVKPGTYEKSNCALIISQDNSTDTIVLENDITRTDYSEGIFEYETTDGKTACINTANGDKSTKPTDENIEYGDGASLYKLEHLESFDYKGKECNAYYLRIGYCYEEDIEGDGTLDASIYNGIILKCGGKIMTVPVRNATDFYYENAV